MAREKLDGTQQKTLGFILSLQVFQDGRPYREDLVLKDSSSTTFCDRTCVTSEPLRVATQPHLLSFIVGFRNLHLVSWLRVMTWTCPLTFVFDRLSQGRIASSSEGVVLPEDRSGGGLQHWRTCDEETMGNFQGRGLQKTSASFMVTREAAPI